MKRSNLNKVNAKWNKTIDPSLFIGITGKQTELEKLQLLLRRLIQSQKKLDIWGAENLINIDKNISFLDDERINNIVLK